METFSSGTRVVKGGSPLAEEAPGMGTRVIRDGTGAPTDVSDADTKEAEWANAVQAASQSQTFPAGELLQLSPHSMT